MMQLQYKFTLPNGKIQKFDVQLDDKTLCLSPKQLTSYPAWTQLSHHKCTNCPLSEDRHPRCPIAANLVDVIDFFQHAISYEEVDAEIITEARTYQKHTALQNALSSLIGVYMVTSGCPIMDKLRPLVRTHLPFANLQETTYRAISMYLMAQYFLYRKGRQPDWDLKNLSKVYEEIQTVNHFFFKRLSELGIEDAGLNALVHLDSYAKFTNMLLLELGLEDIENLFRTYLDSDTKDRSSTSSS